MRWARLLGGIAAVLVCVVLAVAVWSPASSQDDYADRIADLESRVTLLEASVAALQGGQDAPAATPAAETFTIRGEFLLRGGSDAYYLSSRSGACSGRGGFDDILAGAQVRVRDQSGTLLGIGELVEGPHEKRCDFTFTVEVPRSDFYMIAAGHAGREGPSFSFADMESNDWQVALSMG